MRVIIAGSREILKRSLVDLAVEYSGLSITEVVSGKAAGIDRCGESWAHEHGIPVKEFPALWQLHGKAAGALRNAQMAEYAEALIAITSGSPGTKNMIQIARYKKMPVFVLHVCESPTVIKTDPKISIIDWTVTTAEQFNPRVRAA